MKEIISFLDEFFEAEKKVLTTYMVPDLKTYNNAVDSIAMYVVPELKNSFGAKLNTLNDPSFYERVKNFPAPEKRLLFRIDEYETTEKDKLYVCYVSNYNPNGWKSYFDFFIVGIIDSELKIISKFNYSDRGMGGNKRWYFGGGNKKYMHKLNGEYLLNKDSLGNQISIHRILEPSNDADSMKEYSKD